jgi:fructose-bisphosphate aldolase class I
MLQLRPEQETRLEETLANLSTGNTCALDESVASANRMLTKLGLPPTFAMRREYRRVLFATPGFESLYKGVILTSELLGATVSEDPGAWTFPEFLEQNGQTPIVKVDLGMRDVPGFEEGKIILGVETMARDLEEYLDRSGDRVRAGKARQALRVGESDYVLERGMDNLAQMAAECQSCREAILLLLEPEVLRTGVHGIDEHAATSERALKALDKYLEEASVRKDLVAIKTNVVTSGEQSGVVDEPEEVGRKTVSLWRNAIDEEVRLVLMLSGGLDDLSSTEYFNAVVREAKGQSAPFTVTSSFGRAAHRAPVEIWSKDVDHNAAAAQASFAINAAQNELARNGAYEATSDPRRQP